MQYYLLIAVQAFCLYHAYKTRKPYHWYFIIFFIPIIGPLIYIIMNVYNKKDVENIQSDITHAINPTKRIRDLEKKLHFSDTYTNRIALADAYVQSKDFNNAILHYKNTLKDKTQDHLYSYQQLILCNFQIDDFENVITFSKKIKTYPEFIGSKQQFCYGLALKELGETEKAETELQQIDRPYSNYNERLELAKFYLDNAKVSQGKSLLEAIAEEATHMTKTNRRIFKATINEVHQLLKTL